MTQKERYRRTREAMRMTLRHIDADAPDVAAGLREVVDAVSAELPKVEGAAETADKKGWTEMTQEKYKKVAAAMRAALFSIFGNYADVEDRLRTADAEIQSVLLNERICARPASYPIEGIAVEAEKLETENEPDEVADEVKKCLYQGREWDPEKIIEELGDVLWYVALAADMLDVPLDFVMEYNIDKLQKRYPDGFSFEASEERADVHG